MMNKLGTTIVGFPKYIFEWTVGLIIAILSDLHITTLVVTGVAVGFAASSVLIGVATFFVAYSISRIVAHIAEGFVHGFVQHGKAMQDVISYHANTVASSEQPVIKVDDHG